MEEYVWRKGNEKCERSTRNDKPPPPVEHSNDADILPINTSEYHRKLTNNRESSSLKLSERHLIGQTTYNPFMTSNNYVKDIDVQMSFLMPQKG
jgi:hypothetical protein